MLAGAQTVIDSTKRGGAARWQVGLRDGPLRGAVVVHVCVFLFPLYSFLSESSGFVFFVLAYLLPLMR